MLQWNVAINSLALLILAVVVIRLLQVQRRIERNMAAIAGKVLEKSGNNS